MRRRLPALLIVVAALVAVVLGTREERPAETAVFSISASGWMPFAPAPSGLTETWFCAGVPATGIDGVEGEVVIANRTADLMLGTVQLLTDTGEERRIDLSIDPWGLSRIDLDATVAAEVVGAVVELEGGGGIVEQVAHSPNGDSYVPCANATSDTWYFADGFTVDGSLDQIVLTNPFDQPVVVNLEFATREGFRAPQSYSGMTVRARSIRVIDLGAPGAGAQGEPLLAVKVEATHGRLVAGRIQRFLGGGRAGMQVAQGTPALRSQWWFTGGLKTAGATTAYSIYNPTENPVEVDVLFVGISVPTLVDPIVVPARQVVAFDPGQVADLPEGRHATVFATAGGEAAIVVERASTRSIDQVAATTVVGGATARQDAYVASSWHVAVGPPEPTTEALIVYNVDNVAGTVTVSAVGAAGPVPVPGLEELNLPAASLLTIDLTDPVVVGRELVIESTNRIFVERSYPTGRGATRTAAWALPAG